VVTDEHEKRRWRTFWVAFSCFTALFTVTGILLALGSKGAEIATIVAVPVTIVVAFTAIPVLRQNRKVWLAMLVSSVMVGVVTSGIVCWRHTHELDVIGQVELRRADRSSPGDTVLSPGDRAMMKLYAPNSRTYLKITFEVDDHDRSTQNCRPASKLTIILNANGFSRPAIDILPGEPVDIFLGGGVHSIQLIVTLHAEPRCVMNLTVGSAVLHN
jgi:hypothetical protein